MKRHFFIVAILLALASTASAQVSQPEFKTLVWNNSHIVSYEKRGSNLILRMEMIGDHTENRKASRWQDIDFTSIKIDLNNNGKLDRRLDIALAQRSRTEIICTQYLNARDSSSVCGALPSRAKLNVTFTSSPFADVKHPIFEYVIPIKELNVHSQTIGFQFKFHSAPGNLTFYPDGGGLYTDLSQTLSLNLETMQ